ncbi:hypothetical protein LPB03_12250 [Polaribacter vadi]|uniref:Beta-carotene 15,15'-monooxygenase n=1 Tax=Polaribacter vadi TaxID=1774273 RepID=A0A1B8TTD1_9FLAO|nr:DUF6427 family protein [Polaribacter vadi]AOW18175.1 hypothetical protein LPB03_12250 [Polaribacter vadi]OBY62907.1 hypothetical protein LPB3_12265 [Polaribacter vadi]|tara:strand:- start:4355 stop:5284 length:930 start_codon:yes stop_codon:yes gene_type:complete
MLANFLNKSKPINFIGLLILFFVSLSYAFYTTILAESSYSNMLLKFGALTLFFLVIFFFFNFVNSKNRLTFDNSYAYFLFSILLIAVLAELLNYSILIKTIIYLLFLRKIYSLRSNRNVTEKLFDSGFWLGIFFIIEPLSILLFILVYSAIFLHNKITIRTLLTPIIGFISPLIIYFAYNFWFEKTEEFNSLFYFDMKPDLEFYSSTKYLWLVYTTFFLTVFAIIFKSATTLSINNRFRRNWIILIINFFLMLLFIFLTPEKNGSELIYNLFPTSIILANGVELIKKKIIKNIVLYLFLIGGIVSCFVL